MRDACSPGLSPGMIGKPTAVTNLLMVRDPGKPVRTEATRWGLVTAAACAVLTSGEVNAQSQSLVDEGRRIFFVETFDGNGRTCGTCHPATHNFTIDAEFIATLDEEEDPLFVSEQVPELAELEDLNRLRRGLILENLNGFDADPVFRGVPHNIGMSVSIEADPEHLGPTRDAVGWSGDGAPRGGTIRDFLVGAITQHFPKTLAREAGEDFRLPTAREERAVEAFMLSLGRRDEFDLEQMSFLDADAEAGRLLFMGEGVNRQCSFCHHNAGANRQDNGFNGNFDTGVHGFGPPLPPDDGFGSDDDADDTFNTVSLVEAADTPPFFHNNSAATLEDAVRFYTTDNFGNSDAGIAGGGAFDLTPSEVDQVAAFLRAINAIDNARNALAVANDARRMRNDDDAVEILRAVESDIQDGIEVLTVSNLAEDAVAEFAVALELVQDAIDATNRGRRNSTISAVQQTLRGIPELIAAENVDVAGP